MRIRLFNTVEPVSPLYRDLLPKLGELGVEVDVVLSRGDYRPVRRRLETVLNHSRLHVSRVGIEYRENKGKIFKLFWMLAYATGAIRHSLLSHRADLNIFLSQPPLFSIWGYALKLLRNEPYLCIMMDVYPDVAIREKMLSESSLFSWFLGRVSIFTLKNASAVIVIGRCMREKLIAKGIPSSKIHCIPNWVNEEMVYPVPQRDNKLRQELNLGEDFVVLYSGNMGISHDFDDLLEVARRFRNLSGLKFVLIGNGAQWQKVMKFKETEELANLILLPFQPQERLAESLSMGDVHFVSLREGFEGLEVPSKAYSALAVGRPLIYQGQPSGEIALMIEEAGIGSVVPQGDVDELERVILNYNRDRELVAQQGERALRLGKDRYSSTNSVNQYLSLLLNQH